MFCFKKDKLVKAKTRLRFYLGNFKIDRRQDWGRIWDTSLRFEIQVCHNIDLFEVEILL